MKASYARSQEAFLNWKAEKRRGFRLCSDDLVDIFFPDESTSHNAIVPEIGVVRNPSPPVSVQSETILEKDVYAEIDHEEEMVSQVSIVDELSLNMEDKVILQTEQVPASVLEPERLLQIDPSTRILRHEQVSWTVTESITTETIYDVTEERDLKEATDSYLATARVQHLLKSVTVIFEKAHDATSICSPGSFDQLWSRADHRITVGLMPRKPNIHAQQVWHCWRIKKSATLGVSSLELLRDNDLNVFSVVLLALSSVHIVEDLRSWCRLLIQDENKDVAGMYQWAHQAIFQISALTAHTEFRV